jgi:circadian clock protein KaiC
MADSPLSIGQLQKTPTGITGLDEIIEGGLPKGRTTLVCGGPGCGKTLLGVEFIVHGIQEYGEPGVIVAFEETDEELAQNVASLGYNLQKLEKENKLFIDYIYLERSEIEETGAYDLDGLFVRIADAAERVGAKRILLDTIETLFAGLSNEAIIRAEIRRLFHWLKDKGLTAVVTGERGDGTLTRYGLEEYISDCVILLDHRVTDQIAIRRLRVVKYRGSAHRPDEFPFLIGEDGIWVMPLSSTKLDYPSQNVRVSSGIPALDEMLGGKGYFRGSSILITGDAGTGKSSMAATMVDSACRRGEKCLYFAFEEATSQIIRNMRSIHIDLDQWEKKGLLVFHASRPSYYSLEKHLLFVQKRVIEEKPSIVIFDPISNLASISNPREMRSMLVRVVDFLKNNQITTLFTSLTFVDHSGIESNVGVSSLMDTWITLRNLESNGERNRGLYVLKSRGMAHSSQIREFRLTNDGIQLLPVYIGSTGMLVGTARVEQEALDAIDVNQRDQEIQSKERALERKRQAIQAQMAALQIELELEEAEYQQYHNKYEQVEKDLKSMRESAAGSRQPNGKNRKRKIK